MRFSPLLVLAALLLSAAPVCAQDIPTEYTITHHPAATPDAPSITTPYTFLKASAAVSCDQPRIAAPTGVQVNPRFYRWNDPVNTARDCVFDKTLATSPLFADPPPGGDYVAKMVATLRAGSAVLSSTASAPSNPFARGTAPATVLNVRAGGQ